jgi:hypothetical protein
MGIAMSRELGVALNTAKRLVTTPKAYFTDTGTLCRVEPDQGPAL